MQTTTQDSPHTLCKRMRTAVMLSTFVAVGAVLGCSREPVSSRSNSTQSNSTQSNSPPSNPTWASHIAELTYASCTPCHRPGETAPFSLLTYEDVFKRRKKNLEVTAERFMPPWLPDHGDFLDDRRLSDQQISMLRRWVDAGAPRGDRSVEPACPEFSEGWQLGEPDLVVAVTEELVVPAGGAEQFRNYVVPVGLQASRYVAAVEIRPGSPAVHHAVLCVDGSGGCRRRDAADPEPGFAGMDMAPAKPPDGYFLGWTPGKRARKAPSGMSWTLPPGSDLVLQLHLTPTGKVERLQPRIALYFTDEPPTACAYPLCMFAQDIDLPAGASDVIVRDHFLTPVALQVRSIYPHAHYLCRQMAAWATLPDGSRRDLFRIERWDFDWQDDYIYRTPILLPAGARLDFEYHYDNSPANPANPSNPPRHVRLGDRSVDEMGNLTLQVTTADHDSRRALGLAAVRRDLEKVGFDSALLLQLAHLLRESQQLEQALQTIATVRTREPRNADAVREQATCLLLAGRAAEAEQAYRECLELDPAQNLARIQLGGLMLNHGRYPEAIQLYQQALQAAPQMAKLHNNLATAYLGSNDLARAEQHYRTATTLQPSIFQAWFNLGRVYAATGRNEDARIALQRALQLRPNDARALAALQQLGN